MSVQAKSSAVPLFGAHQIIGVIPRVRRPFAISVGKFGEPDQSPQIVQSAGLRPYAAVSASTLARLSPGQPEIPRASWRVAAPTCPFGETAASRRPVNRTTRSVAIAVRG